MNYKNDTLKPLDNKPDYEICQLFNTCAFNIIVQAYYEREMKDNNIPNEQINAVLDKLIWLGTRFCSSPILRWRHALRTENNTELVSPANKYNIALLFFMPILLRHYAFSSIYLKRFLSISSKKSLSTGVMFSDRTIWEVSFFCSSLIW